MARLVPILFVMVLVVAACGSDDSESGDTTANAGTAAGTQSTAATTGEPTQPTDGPVSTQPPAASTEQAESSDPGSAGEAGTATLTLDNGESFEFNVECVTSPMDAGLAGRDLLLSVNSYDGQYLIAAELLGPDQYGSAPLSIIQIWDVPGNEVAWGAYSASGGQVDLRLDGTTVTGTAVFGEGGDTVNPSVPGELVAYC